MHRRRLVKNIRWANQNIGEQRVIKDFYHPLLPQYFGFIKSEKCMGVSQFLAARVRVASSPKSTYMYMYLQIYTYHILLCTCRQALRAFAIIGPAFLNQFPTSTRFTLLTGQPSASCRSPQTALFSLVEFSHLPLRAEH